MGPHPLRTRVEVVQMSLQRLSCAGRTERLNFTVGDGVVRNDDIIRNEKTYREWAKTMCDIIYKCKTNNRRGGNLIPNHPKRETTLGSQVVCQMIFCQLCISYVYFLRIKSLQL